MLCWLDRKKKGQQGKLMKKTWRISSNDPEALLHLDGLRCLGVGEHNKHASSASSDTKESGYYTPMFCDLLHNILQETHGKNMNANMKTNNADGSVAAAGIAEVAVSCSGLAAIENNNESEVHNDRIGFPPIWNGMITKALRPSDPLARGPEAEAALATELGALKGIRVWDKIWR